ncbi:MAG TPA: DUF3943 domain-containing protein [Polyangiaceae bacterium]|nr:DUF3943 domain-containing protein [Polyangiaceae bacterium]
MRAGLEHLAVFGLELGIYWFDPDTNVVDWQFPDLQSKLMHREGFRFDDNLMQTNYVFHSFAGATHYVVSRANGFGVAGSFASAVASSAFYELVLEWKEIVSFNDLIVTPFGGSAMGEFFYHLGNYLGSEPVPASRSFVGYAAQGGARGIVGGPRLLHDAIDDPASPPWIQPDNLGLSTAYAHRFRVMFARDTFRGSSSRLDGLLAADGEFELAAMPGFLRPGRFGLWYTNGNFTSFNARLGYENGSREVELDFDAHFVGWYAQDLRALSDGVSGHAHEASFGTGMHYVDRILFGERDQYGIIHLARAGQKLWLRSEPLRFELAVDASPDFASVKSQAYDEYAARFGREGTKSSLLRHGYFHGWGLSAGASAKLGVGPVEVGARARHGRYEAIDGAERVQEEVTSEPDGSETITEVGASVGFEPKDAPIVTELEYARTSRNSALSWLSASRTWRRFTAAVGVRF